MPEITPRLARLPVPVVIDHMGRLRHSHGVNHPGFVALQRGVGS